MTRALVVKLREWWLAEEQPQIRRVHLVVGDFTCVEPVALQSAFAAYARDSFLAGAELAIRRTPFIAWCERCEAEYQPELGSQYACPSCAAPLEVIRSGRELKIERVESVRPDEALPGAAHASDLR